MSSVDLYGLAEEIVERAEEATRSGHGRYSVEWGKWSRAFNLGLQAASGAEPKTSTVFTLWVVVSKCVEAKHAEEGFNQDDIDAIQFLLEEIGAEDLFTRFEAALK